MPIITSWLDNDLYNFHQGDFFFHRHEEAVGVYAYKCRSKGANVAALKDRLLEELEHMYRLRLNPAEAAGLLEVSLCSKGYVDEISSGPVLERDDVTVGIETSGELTVRYRGPIHKRILVETPLLALMSQLYFEATMSASERRRAHEAGKAWIEEQANYLLAYAPDGFKFTEGGTRRRFSKEHQEVVLATLKSKCPQFLAATSNVYYGLKLGIKVVGTMAHQLQMYYQTVVPLEDSIIKPLEDWDHHFKGRLGTALTDTLGDRKWDFDFTRYLMAMYPVERHDSGCPFRWGERRLRALAREEVPVEGRALLFSDSLDLDKAMDLWRHFSGRIGVSIMIGTYLVNTIPVPGHKPLSQVIKLMWAAPSLGVRLRPVVKLSADVEKSQSECESLTAHAVWVAESCPELEEAA